MVKSCYHGAIKDFFVKFCIKMKDNVAKKRRYAGKYAKYMT